MTKSSQQDSRPLSFVLVQLLLFSIPAVLIFYKLYILNYPLASLIPTVNYNVELLIDSEGHGDDITIKTFLPISNSRQLINDEQSSAGLFTLSLDTIDTNRIASWYGDQIRGKHNFRYAYSVQTKHVRYNIPPKLAIPSSYPTAINKYLQATKGVQVHAPLIDKKIKSLFPAKPTSVATALEKIHHDLQNNFSNRNFSGYTDAITALKLGEASCNGKSRLFIALARNLGIPARLVGGIIMTQGNKKTSHQWVEAYINGFWVPFDTINNHFAEIPANFLTLYYGDQALFTHTTNINFHYAFKIFKKLSPRQDMLKVLSKSPLNIVNLYSTFERVGIPQNLLKIILMIPLGALITVIFRNVIGFETFGTFLPALIAAAARQSGLFWGLVGFMAIILLSYVVRRLLDRLQLLHTAKMGVMLTAVVLFMMAITVTGVHFRLFDLAHITLFPIAILAITAERFAIIEIEQGIKKAMKITLMTLVVISACYVVMDSLFLQSLFVAFPELLLIVIAFNIWIGRWIGIRFMEFLRFRKLIFAHDQEVK